MNHQYNTAAFFSSEQSICPKCRKTIQAKVVFEDEQVFLHKRCKEHGEFKAILSSDINYWVKSLSYTKPGQKPHEYSTAYQDGCPDDCGLCEEHEQHTCAPIIEISNVCDLECPVCIVWNQNNYNMPFEDFKFTIDNLIKKESALELCLLSGGEPTLHPEFFKLAEYASKHPQIRRTLISSHGLKIARSEEFAQRFKSTGLYLSLQFDSLNDANYKSIRGKNLLSEKMKCLEICEKYGIPVIIVPTVARGFNDKEIGEIINFGLSLDCVTSITVQPAAYTGAGGTSFPSDPLRKLTQVDLHRLIDKQTGWLKENDFIPIPCAHPSCYTAVYLLKVDREHFVPLTHFGDLTTYMNALTNNAILKNDANVQKLIQDAIYNLWSAQSITVDQEKIINSIKTILSGFQKNKNLTESTLHKISEKNIKAIFIHSFMDEFDFNVSRIRKCCTHYALPDGRLMPGCSYNNIHRFKDKRLKLENVLPPERQPLPN